MTDPTLEAPERGRLHIADRVVDRIASHAATTVDGVVETGSGLDKLVGRRLPKVSSRVSGDMVRVDVDIAVQWPHSAGEIARAVSSTVAERVNSLSGLEVSAVDVTVARLELNQQRPVRRVS